MDGQHSACVLRPKSPSSALGLPQSYARFSCSGRVLKHAAIKLVEKTRGAIAGDLTVVLASRSS